MADESAPAGWYPTADGRLRYWDGTAWTEHHSPLPARNHRRPAKEESTAKVIVVAVAASLSCVLLFALIWIFSLYYLIDDSQPVVTITQSPR